MYVVCFTDRKGVTATNIIRGSFLFYAVHPHIRRSFFEVNRKYDLWSWQGCHWDKLGPSPTQEITLGVLVLLGYDLNKLRTEYMY